MDRILQMTVKTLTDVTVGEALAATRRQGSAELRRRIDKLARQRIGEGPALIRLQALLERARRVTERRNSLIHDVWVRFVDDGAAMILNEDEKAIPVPSVEDLESLGRDIEALTYEINEARLRGFLAQAVQAKSGS
jgi:hypothetical protein